MKRPGTRRADPHVANDRDRARFRAFDQSVELWFPGRRSKTFIVASRESKGPIESAPLIFTT